MSGIAGIIWFDREFTAETPVSDLLLRLEHRALDGSIMRRHGRAEFGYAHTALRRNQVATDHIEVCARTNRLAVVDACLHNARELAEACGLAPSLGADGPSTAQLVLAAYEKWGMALADKLRGEFALVIWDPSTQEIYAARDAFGCRPLFLAHRAGQFAFASEVQSLVGAGVVDLKPNLVALSDFIVHSIHRAFEETFVQGVTRVRAGHYAVIGASRFTQFRYWPFPGAGLSASESNQLDLASGFRGRLKASVEASMACVDGPLAIELSGGYDSSAIALLAAEHLAVAPRVAPIQLISFVYPGLSCDESIYSEAVAACTPFTHVKIPAPSLASAASAFAACARQSCSPVIDPSWPRTFAWGRTIRSLGARVALTGLGGDDLTWDPDYVLAHAFQGRHFRAVIEAISSHQSPSARDKAIALRSLALAIARRAGSGAGRSRIPRDTCARNVEPWVKRAALASDCSAFPPDLLPEELASSWGNRAIGELVSWLISPAFLGAMEFMELYASRQGVTLKHPFLDRDLADWVLRMSIDRRRGYHWRIKSLLLQSLLGDWPKPLLSRGTKATFDEYLIAAYKPAAAVLPDGLRCSDALIDWQEVTRARESLGRLTQSGQVPGLFGQGRAMWIPVATETWLHVCGGIN